MAAQEHPLNDFGLLIAYVVPGFLALFGASYFSPEIRVWIGHPPADAPTLGGFLYMTIASVICGLTLSTVRWMVIDSIHHRTGIRRPAWDFSLFQKNLEAYKTLNEIHYRYYQFYGNSLLALIWLYCLRRASFGFWAAPLGWTDAGFALVIAVFFLGSRDTLQKFYARTDQLLKSSRARK